STSSSSFPWSSSPPSDGEEFFTFSDIPYIVSINLIMFINFVDSVIYVAISTL
ncbi:unnamed protein product, partial [Nesidiocoris tenuis]